MFAEYAAVQNKYQTRHAIFRAIGHFELAWPRWWSFEDKSQLEVDF